MVDRVLDRRHQHLITSWQDIAVAESVNAAFKPASEFMDLLSGENDVSITSVKPVPKLLTGDVLEPSDEDEHQDKTKYALMEEMQDGRCAANASVVGDKESSVQAMATCSKEDDSQRPADVTGWSSYLPEEPVVSNADPLAWWCNNHSRFPLLSKVACRYMCICATFTPSEMIFSPDRNIDGEQIFNRAKLLNVGYTEALKEYDYECFIFSDVDLIPMDDRNTYKCFSQPRHLSVSMDKFGFRLPYNQYFGGVSSMSKEQYLKINGFPNNYWGWGGEDDDIYNRLASKGMSISRPSGEVGKCRMIRHDRDKKNEPNPQR
eukprot:superscaffoldBa00008683_g23553